MMAEGPHCSFVMHGARGTMAGGLTHIKQHVKAIAQGVLETPNLAIENVRGL